MTDWTLLGGADPAPGDPAQLRLRLGQVERTAEDMRELSRELSRIARGSEDADWRGAAADAMRTVLDDFRYDLHPIANSFESLSSGLGRYAGKVEALQMEARQALNRAKVAEGRRQAAESQRRAAAANLAAQRRAVLARQAEQVTHQAVTSVTVDPAARAVEADQGRMLADQVARAQRSVAESESQVFRFEAAVSNADAEIRQERTRAGTIREEWERASNTAKVGVEAALAEALRNVSNLGKVLSSVEAFVVGVSDFIDANIELVYKLRDILGWIGQVAGFVAMILAIAAPIVGAFFPPAGAVLLAWAGTAATIAAVCLVAKVVLTLFLTTQRDPHGRPRVTTGDVVADGISAVLALVGAGEASKAAGRAGSHAKLLYPRGTGTASDVRTAYTAFKYDTGFRMNGVHHYLDGSRFEVTRYMLNLPVSKFANPIARWGIDESLTESGKYLSMKYLTGGNVVRVPVPTGPSR